MSNRQFPEPGSGSADGLDVHLHQFLASLERSGYAAKTRHDKRRAIGPFIRWVKDARLAVADLDEACVTAFLSRPSRRPCKHKDPEPAAVRQFLCHLRAVGVVAPCARLRLSAAEVLVRQYLDDLRNERGLCARSIEVYSPYVRAFVERHRLPEGNASLDASAVRKYVLEVSQDRSVPFVKLLAAALRSFLRYLFLKCGVASDLSTAIPPVRRWRLAPVPPFLTPEEVEQVIAATDRSTARGQRAVAILLLLARLGLRAGEIVVLELDDIRWDAGEIVVHGKGRLVDRLPLLDDVGEALAVYLRDARGRSASRRVFLRLYAPHVGLAGPSAVCAVAREALRRAELRPAGRAAAHVFRHSLARRMIQDGASLGEISQVLRHRSTDTTLLYAKVEFEALSDVTLPWPSAEQARS